MTRIRNGLAATAVLVLALGAGSARATTQARHADVNGAVGQAVTLDGEQVHTVVGAQRWYGGGFWQPPAGKAAVTTEIKVDAVQKTSYNAMYYTLAGPGDETYGRVIIGLREPALHSSNNLMSGQSASGWLTFLVPATQLQGLRLVYHMHSGFGSTLTVPLGAIPDSVRTSVGRPGVVAGEQSVTVTKVERPATVGMWKPAAGTTYLTAYVKVRALKPTTVKRRFSAFAPGGSWAGTPMMGSRTPTFPYTTRLAAGRTVEGWVTFLVKRGQPQHGLTLVYHLYDNRDTLLVRLP